MSSISKETIQKLFLFQQEVSKSFRDIFRDENQTNETTSIYDNVNFPVPVDVFETDDEIIIEAELPGMSKEEIEVTVEEDLIIIKGYKKDRSAQPQKPHFYCMERDFGKFNRVIDIPSSVNINNAEATYDSGILHIEVPKIKEKRGVKRKIEVN
ncbi:MAG: Hsp20/alpha crystallin family protein [Pseudomonadota bacterium]